MKSYSPAVPAGYGSLEYTWNSIGQKTSMKVPAGAGNVARLFEYRYDSTGRQVGLDVKMSTSVSSTGTAASVPGDTTRFFYDSSQNRTKLINKAGDVYQYVYDPTASFPAAVYEQGPQGRYVNVREPDGALVSREKYNNSGTRVANSIYHFDGLGSTRAISDGSGTITDTYSYDAWGNTTHTSGTTADNPYQYVGRYGYYSHYQEPDFHLLQLGVRYYDPEMGRFTSRDPRKDGLNHYEYCGDRPTRGIDPRGTDWTEVDWFKHYCFTGKGKAVDLGDVGLLDELRSAIASEIRYYERDQELAVMQKAKDACRGGKKNKSILIEFNTKDETYRPNVTWAPGLFVVGHTRVSVSGFCSATVNCCTNKVRFCCYSNWTLRDRFADPLDVANIIPWDIEICGGIPFDITASWREKMKCGTTPF